MAVGAAPSGRDADCRGGDSAAPAAALARAAAFPAATSAVMANCTAICATEAALAASPAAAAANIDGVAVYGATVGVPRGVMAEFDAVQKVMAEQALQLVGELPEAGRSCLPCCCTGPQLQAALQGKQKRSLSMIAAAACTFVPKHMLAMTSCPHQLLACG